VDDHQGKDWAFMSETADRMKSIIAEFLDLDPATVTEASSFGEDFEVDSLAMMELVIAFEEEFAIETDEASLDKITNVGDAIEAVEKLRRSAVAS
jgi:acyl carrier protein